MYDSLTDGVDPARPVRPDAPQALVPVGLGKRQGNLLTAVLRGIPLMGGQSMVPFAEADVRRCLARFQPAEDGEAVGLVNRLRPKLLDAVVGPAARLHGYIMGLPEGGVEPLLDAVGRAVRRPLVLRVVFGATTQMPLRALSYVLPAACMAVRVHDVTGRLPYLQALYLGRLGARINALPARGVAEEGRLLADCLDRMLGTTGLAGRYGVYVDRPSPSGEDSIEATVRGLGRRRGEVSDRLRGKGGSLSDYQTLRYAAAHVLLHDRDAVPLERVRGSRVPDDPVVIDVGGLQERHFYNVRAIFAAETRSPAPGALVLSRHSVPPYTMSRGGDIGLRDFLTGGTGGQDETRLPAAVRHDLQLLRRSGALEALR